MAERDRGSLARQRRARRPHQAVQGALPQAPLRRARLRAVRAHLRAARVLPDAHRAGDPPRPRAAEIVGLTGAGELVELGAGASAKARILLDAMREAGTLRRYVPLDVSESVVAGSRGRARRRLPRAGRSTASSATSSATSSTCPRAATRRGWSPCSAARSATSRPGTRRAILAKIAGLLGEGDRLLLGCDLLKDSHVIEAAYNDSDGRDRRVQPQPPARAQPRARRRLPARAASTTWPSSTASTSGSRCACAPSGPARCWSAISTCASSSPPARSCAPRSAPSSPPSACEADLQAAGLALERWFTDEDALFGLALARRASSDRTGCRAARSASPGPCRRRRTSTRSRSARCAPAGR